MVPALLRCARSTHTNPMFGSDMTEWGRGIRVLSAKCTPSDGELFGRV